MAEKEAAEQATAETHTSEPEPEPEQVTVPPDQSVTAAVIANLDKRSKERLTWWGTFLIIWFAFAIAGLIASAICLHKDGPNNCTLTGLFVALLFGPFYWVYFGILHKQGKYCVGKTSIGPDVQKVEIVFPKP